jgi:FAD binding domain/Berberine and berberine like
MLVQDTYDELRHAFQGALLRPEDPGYTDAMPVWNGFFSHRPGLIARCLDANDVKLALRAAAAHGVLTAVRCGGHSLAGFSSCDEGLVVDLAGLREVHVDPDARSARFGGGSLLGTVDSATQRFGLAFPAGVVSHTGAGGLVLGGGTGWLNRLHGLSCDNVEAFTIITADGSALRASEKENADLFWGLRGAGGNFGVVTEFEVRLHPVESVILGRALCGGKRIFALLRHWREFMPEAPDELRWGFSLRIAGSTNDIPAGLRGRPVASASAVWIGTSSEGRRQVGHAMVAEEHEAVCIEEMPFLRLQSLADSDFPHGRRYYTKSGYLRSLPDSVIEILIESLATIPSCESEIELAYLGGAVARVGRTETAFGDRSAPFIINIISNWAKSADDQANIGWTRKLFQRLQPAMVPGVYVNFMSGDEEERVPEAYRERWDRLRAIKTAYDPDNFFRLNHNIPPSP